MKKAQPNPTAHCLPDQFPVDRRSPRPDQVILSSSHCHWRLVVQQVHKKPVILEIVLLSLQLLTQFHKDIIDHAWGCLRWRLWERNAHNRLALRHTSTLSDGVGGTAPQPLGSRTAPHFCHRLWSSRAGGGIQTWAGCWMELESPRAPMHWPWNGGNKLAITCHGLQKRLCELWSGQWLVSNAVDKYSSAWVHALENQLAESRQQTNMKRKPWAWCLSEKNTYQSQ